MKTFKETFVENNEINEAMKLPDVLSGLEKMKLNFQS